MTQESIVYGYIRSSNDLLDEQGVSYSRINKHVLTNLPYLDPAAFVSREIFSNPIVASYDDSLQSTVIHFGKAYNGIEYEWNSWIAHFEKVLQQMCWNYAVVNLETELSGTHTFTWDSGGVDHTPSQQPLNIRCEWQHELGVTGS